MGLLCGAVLLLAPLAAFAEGQSDYYEMMATADGMYVAASYGLAVPGTTTFHVPAAGDTQTDADAGTDWGLLGGRLAAGYSISGFRPELAFGYRTARINSVTLTKLPGVTEETLKSLNDALEDFDWKDSSISSLEVVASVYYDIDTGTLVIPYIGAGAGASQISVTLEENTTLAQFEESESAWALAFQGAAGVGFYVFDGLTTSIGYRLTGTTEATFTDSDNKVGLALGHHIELGIRYRF